MPLRLEDKYLVLIQFGKGFIVPKETSHDRESIFRIASWLQNGHHRQHKKGTVPTIHVYERIGFIKVEPRPNNPKKIPNKSIPKGVIKDA
jgi:hypothetical protein